MAAIVGTESMRYMHYNFTRDYSDYKVIAHIHIRRLLCCGTYVRLGATKRAFQGNEGHDRLYNVSR